MASNESRREILTLPHKVKFDQANAKSGDFDQVWRNTRWGRNTQYLRHDEVESFFPKLWKLLQAFGSAFNDKWAYRKTKKYVLRFAVWDKPQSGSFWEDKDIRRRDVMQKKLLEAKQ